MIQLNLMNPLIHTINKVRILHVSVTDCGADWYIIDSIFHYIAELSVAVSKTVLLNYYKVVAR